MDQQKIYKHLWAAHADETILDQSLKPRSPDLLFDEAFHLGIDASWNVLDVGCGRGHHVVELAQRFGCRVKGLDPVESNLQLCRESLNGANVSNRVEFIRGAIEAIPFDSNEFDLVWCRDMLVHVNDLKSALQECYRVLKPGGILLVLTTFATDSMEQKEQNELCLSLALTSANLSRAYMEHCFTDIGLEVLSTRWLGSEFAEFYEERDGRYSRELSRIARMTRQPQRFVKSMGKDNFKVSLALYTWGIYQLLGKLGIMVYALKKKDYLLKL